MERVRKISEQRRDIHKAGRTARHERVHHLLMLRVRVRSGAAGHEERLDAVAP